MEEKFVRLDKLAEVFGYKNLTPEIDLHEIKLYERSINRPAFQLTGFFGTFVNRRIQIVGRGEHEYMNTLSPAVLKERCEKLFSFRFPCTIIAWGMQPFPNTLEIARRYGVPILSTEKPTARVIVEVVRWMTEQLAETETMYGVLANVYGEGILITGPSGIGKSETAIELIKRGHRFVADDIVEISKISEEMIIGRAPELTRHFVEVRGLGIVDVRSLYGVESVMEFSPINMIINLEEWDGTSSYDRLGLEEEYQEILGLNIVKHTLPIRSGRNPAIIIEAAAVNNRQKQMGYVAAKELCNRVSQEINKHKLENEQENND